MHPAKTQILWGRPCAGRARDRPGAEGRVLKDPAAGRERRATPRGSGLVRARDAAGPPRPADQPRAGGRRSRTRRHRTPAPVGGIRFRALLPRSRRHPRQSACP